MKTPRQQVRAFAVVAHGDQKYGGDHEIALLVKVADRLANVRACVQDRREKLWARYRGEHPAFKAAAYRRGQCEPLWAELESLLAETAFAERPVPTPE